MYAQPYSTYKPLNVDWLGEVPDHWEVLRLKSVVHQVSEQVYGSQEKMPYVALEHIESWTGRVLPHVVETPDSQLKQFRSGDVLFGKLRPYLAKVVRANHSGLCVSEFLVLRATDRISERFLAYLLRSKPAIDWINSSTFGARMPRADWQFVGDTKLPLPSLAEQTAIARFLDHATDQTERYIHAKEKLIALLDEQKQVMIHDAVTGRIDVRTGQPYPTYKPSDIEWLGNVPAQWKVRKLRQCVKIVGGMTPRMEERRFWDGRIPWVTPKDMKREVVSDSSVRVSKAALSDTTLRLINPPVVLMVVRGMILARKIPIAWTSHPVTINQDMKALIPTSDMDAAFLARALTAAQDTIALWVDVAGHGTRRLPTECWRELVVPVPPKVEQTAILDFIETESTRINDASKCARREIKFLREYRTRLIADVVTGKLDVREAAANLPELEAIADGGDETIPAEPDSQQSNTTLHPPATPGVDS